MDSIILQTYIYSWVLLGISATLLLLTGNAGNLVMVILSFAGIALAFMGMISILPIIIEREEKASIRTIVFAKQKGS